MLIYLKIEQILFYSEIMSNKTKRKVILTEVELKKTLSRLTSEIVEKVKETLG